MAENTYTVTYKENGRQWTLRPLPPHFLLMFGQLPTNMTEKAAAALSTSDEGAFAEEVQKTLSPKQVFDTAIFAREAVKFALVKPRIALIPESEDEISAFEVSEDEFKFLVQTVMAGGASQSAAKFRGKSR